MFGLIPFKTHNTNEVGETFADFMSDFFNDDFFPTMGITSQISKFNADVRETDKEYLVSAELPGVRKEDISLDYYNDNLIIKAKRQEVNDDAKENYIRKEICYGEFSRSFYLNNVNKDGIRARFENGQLKVILPKRVSGQHSNSSILIE